MDKWEAETGGSGSCPVNQLASTPTVHATPYATHTYSQSKCSLTTRNSWNIKVKAETAWTCSFWGGKTLVPPMLQRGGALGLTVGHRSDSRQIRLWLLPWFAGCPSLGVYTFSCRAVYLSRVRAVLYKALITLAAAYSCSPLVITLYPDRSLAPGAFRYSRNAWFLGAARKSRFILFSLAFGRTKWYTWLEGNGSSCRKEFGRKKMRYLGRSEYTRQLLVAAQLNKRNLLERLGQPTDSVDRALAVINITGEEMVPLAETKWRETVNYNLADIKKALQHTPKDAVAALAFAQRQQRGKLERLGQPTDSQAPTVAAREAVEEKLAIADAEKWKLRRRLMEGKSCTLNKSSKRSPKETICGEVFDDEMA